MLGDKDRRGAMAHRCLLAIVRDDSWRQSLGDNLAGMLTDGRQTLIGDNLPILLVQIKAASELGMGEKQKERGDGLTGEIRRL